MEFEADAEGELTLSVGETVTVEKDDPDDEDRMDRWVYGLNPLTEKRGWFPLSHTNNAQVLAAWKQSQNEQVEATSLAAPGG